MQCTNITRALIEALAYIAAISVGGVSGDHLRLLVNQLGLREASGTPEAQGE